MIQPPLRERLSGESSHDVEAILREVGNNFLELADIMKCTPAGRGRVESISRKIREISGNLESLASDGTNDRGVHVGLTKASQEFRMISDYILKEFRED